jgi:hypothetical protein
MAAWRGSTWTPPLTPLAPLIEAQAGERRREERKPVDSIPALLLNAVAIPARVLDISISGLRVSVDRALRLNEEVTVSFQHTIAAGRVRFCRPDENGELFQVGLQLEDVLNRI